MDVKAGHALEPTFCHKIKPGNFGQWCLFKGTESKTGQRLLIEQGLAFSNVKVTVPSQIVEVTNGKARLWLANCSDFPVHVRKSRFHLLSCELDPDPGFVHEVVNPLVCSFEGPFQQIGSARKGWVDISRDAFLAFFKMDHLELPICSTIEDLLWEFSDNFARSDDDLGHYRGITHRKNTGNHPPYASAPTRSPLIWF